MRALTRNLLFAGGGVAVLSVIGAVLVPANGDGEYDLHIYPDNNRVPPYATPLKGSPFPGPYKISPIGSSGTIDWTFTNHTGDDMKVQIEQFQCDGVLVKDCPLRFDRPGPDCSSDTYSLSKQGGTTTVSATYNPMSRCPQQDMSLDLWNYTIEITSSCCIFHPDPELEIDHDSLKSLVGSVRVVLRRIKRFMHL
jgi:hypothetical protein